MVKRLWGGGFGGLTSEGITGERTRIRSPASLCRSLELYHSALVERVLLVVADHEAPEMMIDGPEALDHAPAVLARFRLEVDIPDPAFPASSDRRPWVGLAQPNLDLGSFFLKLTCQKFHLPLVYRSLNVLTGAP